DAFGSEPLPNGGRINMGAYGNSPQASKSITQEPPNPVSTPVAISRDGEAEIRWRNPMNADYGGVVIVRRAGSAPTGQPQSGVTYQTNDSLGDGVIVYAGDGGGGANDIASFHDVSVDNGSHYYYLVFAYN